MQLLALMFLAAWLYSLASFIYFPLKFISLKRRSASIWTFFTRSRLLLSALAYVMAAPFFSFVLIAIAAGGVSGSNASGIPDSLENFGWGICAMFVACAVLSLLFAFLRPSDSTGNAGKRDIT